MWMAVHSSQPLSDILYFLCSSNDRLFIHLVLLIKSQNQNTSNPPLPHFSRYNLFNQSVALFNSIMIGSNWKSIRFWRKEMGAQWWCVCVRFNSTPLGMVFFSHVYASEYLGHRLESGWLTFLLRTFKMCTFVSTACSAFAVQLTECQQICISITRPIDSTDFHVCI